MLDRNQAGHLEICDSANGKLVEPIDVSALRDSPFLTPSQTLLPLLTFPLYFTNMNADKMGRDDESHMVFLCAAYGSSDTEQKKPEW